MIMTVIDVTIQDPDCGHFSNWEDARDLNLGYLLFENSVFHFPNVFRDSFELAQMKFSLLLDRIGNKQSEDDKIAPLAPASASAAGGAVAKDTGGAPATAERDEVRTVLL